MSEHDYVEESFFKTGFEILKEKWIRGKKLIVDFTFKPDVLKGAPEYVRTEKWVKTPAKELHAIGYKEAEGIHDSILWSYVKIYVRFHNEKEFPISQVFPEKKDTAYTLNDAMLSTSDRDFKKGLARAQLTATADWQKMFLIMIIGAGIILGTKMMGFW